MIFYVAFSTIVPTSPTSYSHFTQDVSCVTQMSHNYLNPPMLKTMRNIYSLLSVKMWAHFDGNKPKFWKTPGEQLKHNPGSLPWQTALSRCLCTLIFSNVVSRVHKANWNVTFAQLRMFLKYKSYVLSFHFLKNLFKISSKQFSLVWAIDSKAKSWALERGFLECGGECRQIGCWQNVCL